MSVLSGNTSQGQWQAACCGFHALVFCSIDCIKDEMLNFAFSAKTLRDLQSNAPPLRLVTIMVSVKLAVHLKMILLGRVLLLSHTCWRWPSSMDPIVLCWSRDRNPNFPAASYMCNDLQPNPCAAVLSLMKLRFAFWMEQLFTVGSFICWMCRGEKRSLHLVLHREQTLSNNIQACISHLCRMQPNVPLISNGSQVQGKQWKPLCWLQLIFRATPQYTGLSLIMKAEHRTWQRSRASLTYC